MQVVMTACARRWTMREVATELKGLRLYGMSSAWDDLVAQGNSVGLQTALAGRSSTCWIWSTPTGLCVPSATRIAQCQVPGAP